MKGMGMDNPLLFKEIAPGTDLLQLEPGMYAVNCADRFTGENTESSINRRFTPDMITAYFSGVLLPYFVHNINNLMVGVMGNLDLAEMFMPEIEKVAPKLNAARAATGSVVDFIRDISAIHAPLSEVEVSWEDLNRVITTLKAACGRSVSTDGLDRLKLHKGIPCGNSGSLLNTVRGMGVWCVLCMGGNGSVEGTVNEGRITLCWNRPPGSGKSHMPGGESASEVLNITGGMAVSAGYRLIVENWTDSTGTVTLAFE